MSGTFKRIGFKVKIIEWELMESITFLCLALIVKYISETMDVVNQLLVTKVNYKRNSYLDNYLKKLFVKHAVLIFSLVKTAFL